MEMKIHRMTDRGKQRFIEFLDRLKGETPEPFPQELLTDSTYASSIGGDSTWLDEFNLNDRLATAKGLDKIIRRLELSSAEKDDDFWTWCSAYLFEKLCKRGPGGKLKPGEIPIWIAEHHNWKRYYRHYLASIWQVYFTHRDKEDELIVLLNGPVNTPGELWAQIAATQTLITNSSLIDAIYQLYWNAENNTRKTGAGGNSPRRLTQVLKQFEKTFDFFSMTGEQMIELLPSEFDRFKNNQQETANNT
jgi:hypothetical protein